MGGRVTPQGWGKTHKTEPKLQKHANRLNMLKKKISSKDANFNKFAPGNTTYWLVVRTPPCGCCTKTTTKSVNETVRQM